MLQVRDHNFGVVEIEGITSRSGVLTPVSNLTGTADAGQRVEK